jgi:hypothetical protein
LLQQTNTADMLDEALAYVKFLQRQIQVLSTQVLFWVHLVLKPLVKKQDFAVFTFVST